MRAMLMRRAVLRRGGGPQSAMLQGFPRTQSSLHTPKIAL